MIVDGAVRGRLLHPTPPVTVGYASDAGCGRPTYNRARLTRSARGL